MPAQAKTLAQSVEAAIDLLPSDGSKVNFEDWRNQVLSTNDPNARDALARIVKLKLVDMLLTGGTQDMNGVRVKPYLVAGRKS